MNDLDLRTIGKMILQALIWGAASFLVSWQGDTTWQAAAKIAAGITGSWIIGNLQRTGGVTPTIEGLKK